MPEHIRLRFDIQSVVGYGCRLPRKFLPRRTYLSPSPVDILRLYTNHISSKPHLEISPNVSTVPSLCHARVRATNSRECRLWKFGLGFRDFVQVQHGSRVFALHAYTDSSKSGKSPAGTDKAKLRLSKNACVCDARLFVLKSRHNPALPGQLKA